MTTLMAPPASWNPAVTADIEVFTDLLQAFKKYATFNVTVEYQANNAPRHVFIMSDRNPHRIGDAISTTGSNGTPHPTITAKVIDKFFKHPLLGVRFVSVTNPSKSVTRVLFEVPQRRYRRDAGVYFLTGSVSFDVYAAGNPSRVAKLDEIFERFNCRRRDEHPPIIEQIELSTSGAGAETVDDHNLFVFDSSKLVVDVANPPMIQTVAHSVSVTDVSDTAANVDTGTGREPHYDRMYRALQQAFHDALIPFIGDTPDMILRDELSAIASSAMRGITKRIESAIERCSSRSLRVRYPARYPGGGFDVEFEQVRLPQSVTNLHLFCMNGWDRIDDHGSLTYRSECFNKTTVANDGSLVDLMVSGAYDHSNIHLGVPTIVDMMELAACPLTMTSMLSAISSCSLGEPSDARVLCVIPTPTGTPTFMEYDLHTGSFQPIRGSSPAGTTPVAVLLIARRR